MRSPVDSQKDSARWASSRIVRATWGCLTSADAGSRGGSDQRSSCMPSRNSNDVVPVASVANTAPFSTISMHAKATGVPSSVTTRIRIGAVARVGSAGGLACTRTAS